MTGQRRDGGDGWRQDLIQWPRDGSDSPRDGEPSTRGRADPNSRPGGRLWGSSQWPDWNHTSMPRSAGRVHYRRMTIGYFQSCLVEFETSHFDVYLQGRGVRALTLRPAPSTARRWTCQLWHEGPSATLCPPPRSARGDLGSNHLDGDPYVIDPTTNKSEVVPLGAETLPSPTRFGMVLASWSSGGR